jgi:hypothetical protein
MLITIPIVAIFRLLVDPHKDLRSNEVLNLNTVGNYPFAGIWTTRKVLLILLLLDNSIGVSIISYLMVELLWEEELKDLEGVFFITLRRKPKLSVTVGYIERVEFRWPMALMKLSVAERILLYALRDIWVETTLFWLVGLESTCILLAAPCWRFEWPFVGVLCKVYGLRSSRHRSWGSVGFRVLINRHGRGSLAKGTTP